MTEQSTSPDVRLSGTADERRSQLAHLAERGPLSAEWLKRELDAVLDAWAEDETVIDVEEEARTDF